MSALHAGQKAPSEYLRSKADGEAVITGSGSYHHHLPPVRYFRRKRCLH